MTEASRIVTVGDGNGLMAVNHLSSLEKALVCFSRASVEERGAVFTRREVVEFILDLAGYTADRPLHLARLLEPSFGRGDFLLVVAERLLKAYRCNRETRSDIVIDLRDSVRAVELHPESFEGTSQRLRKLLCTSGLDADIAAELARIWLIRNDFLLQDLLGPFSHVVGNPPYVRQELVPDELIGEYRQHFSTIFDRADLYIPFIEKSLSLLAPSGALGFICSDRWMKNRYGGPLRRFVAERFYLKYYVDMVDTQAFLSEVTAYPAIFVITNDKPGPTRLAHRPLVDKRSLRSLATSLLSHRKDTENVKEVAGVTDDAQPWILESLDQLSLVRRLEAEFPTLEEAGCKVGIGVATGADDVFIQPFDQLDVEPDRKLPLVMTRDILAGTVEWRGYGVVNPFSPTGPLVRLDGYPKLARYMGAHEETLRGRYVAQKNTDTWYRTIDRIYPELAAQPKLLIPDIKIAAHVVYEDGRLYPHHNLYYITSTDWDLRALQAVLMSGIARLFVSVYSVKMRGGYLRFQAQYLRRIRIPRWSDVPDHVRGELMTCAKHRDWIACYPAVFDLYGMSVEERAALGGNGV